LLLTAADTNLSAKQYVTVKASRISKINRPCSKP